MYRIHVNGENPYQQIYKVKNDQKNDQIEKKYFEF